MAPDSPRAQFRRAIARAFPGAPDEEAALFRWVCRDPVQRRRLDLAAALGWLEPQTELPLLLRSCRYRGAAFVHDPSFEAPSPFSVEPLKALRERAELFTTRLYQPYVENEEEFEWAALTLSWEELPLEWCFEAWHTYEVQLLALDPHNARLLSIGFRILEELTI